MRYHEAAAKAANGQRPVVLSISVDFRPDPKTGRMTIPSRKPLQLAKQHVASGGMVMLNARFAKPDRPQGWASFSQR